MPSSSISSLTFSSHGSNKYYGTHQAINEVLYGSTPTSFEFASSLMPSNMGLCCLLIPEVLQLQEQSKLVLLLSSTSHFLLLFQGVVLQDICQNHCSLLPTFRLQLPTKAWKSDTSSSIWVNHILKCVLLLFPIPNGTYSMMIPLMPLHCSFGWVNARDSKLSSWITLDKLCW
jgi:hypothetical protein